MKISLFGATGSLGRECLAQCLAAGYEVTALVRNPDKLPVEMRKKIGIVQGDALVAQDVLQAVPENTHAIVFAVGVDEKTSPPDLCTDVTRHIMQAMREREVDRLVWCGGGSNFRPEDQITFGARFVRWFSERFLHHRHSDKEHQLALLDASPDIRWLGVRPLQMRTGAGRGEYLLGFNTFSGFSHITFADCAHAMVQMIEDDTWIGKAPIIRY